MYYEEKWIMGKLHYRGTPDGKWIEADTDMLHARLQEAESKVKRRDGPNTLLLDFAKRIQADTVLKAQSPEYYKRLINVYKLWADDAINGLSATGTLQEKP